MHNNTKTSVKTTHWHNKNGVNDTMIYRYLIIVPRDESWITPNDLLYEH